MKDYELKCYEGSHPRILVTEEFVEINKLKLIHTPEELAAKLKQKATEVWSHWTEILVYYVPYELVKDMFSKEYQDAIADGSKVHTVITDVYETTQDMLDYMVFGWTKALDERGLSASRTIDKVACWLWLLDRDDLRLVVIDDDKYNPYGTPALIALNEALGIESPADLVEFSQHKAER